MQLHIYKYENLHKLVLFCTNISNIESKLKQDYFMVDYSHSFLHYINY